MVGVGIREGRLRKDVCYLFTNLKNLFFAYQSAKCSLMFAIPFHFLQKLAFEKHRFNQYVAILYSLTACLMLQRVKAENKLEPSSTESD